MDFKLSNEIYEELTSNKYPTLFEIEIGGKEKIKVVRYDDYKKLENIIKEVREYVNNYFIIGAGSEYLRRLNEILEKENKWKKPSIWRY